MPRTSRTVPGRSSLRCCSTTMPMSALPSLAHWKRQPMPNVFELTLQLVKAVNQLDVRGRLPLVDMSLPALRALSVSQYNEFIKCFLALVDADQSDQLVRVDAASHSAAAPAAAVRSRQAAADRLLRFAATGPAVFRLAFRTRQGESTRRRCGVSKPAHGKFRKLSCSFAARGVRFERSGPGTTRPGSGHTEAAGPVGRCVCIVHLRRCGGERDGVRAAAGDLRHARLPDAAAGRGAGGIAVALRSATSEQRVVKPQPSHDSFAQVHRSRHSSSVRLCSEACVSSSTSGFLRSRNAAAREGNHSGTSHRADPRGKRRVSPSLARTAHEAAARGGCHGHLSSDAIVSARRARPAAQPGIHDRRVVSRRRRHAGRHRSAG